MALTNAAAFDLRPYSYTSDGKLIENARRIGGLIQPQIDIAIAGDTVLVGKGRYAENLTVDKRIMLVGAGSGSDLAANTVLRPATGNVVTITGTGASDADPLLLKALRIEPQGTVGINLGNGSRTLAETISYARVENVQVAGVQNQAFTENERCLNLDYNKSVAHLTVLDSSFSQCDHGWAFFKNNGPDITSNTAQFVSVTNLHLRATAIRASTWRHCPMLSLKMWSLKQRSRRQLELAVEWRH